MFHVKQWEEIMPQWTQDKKEAIDARNPELLVRAADR